MMLWEPALTLAVVQLVACVKLSNCMKERAFMLLFSLTQATNCTIARVKAGSHLKDRGSASKLA